MSFRQQLASAIPGRETVLAIGVFDGVHRGHRALIAEAAAAAAKLHGTPGVLTFDPHPARFFAPQLAPPMILSLPRRLELLQQAGAKFAVVEPFDAAFSRLDAAAFVRDVLAGDLGARHVVVGYDFTFGSGRSGTPPLLVDLGSQLGMTVDVVGQVLVDNLVCSSTKIREFAMEGRMEGAALLLGRPFEVTGTVVRGAARGRTLGFPTANLRPHADLLPRTGIYAAWARMPDDPTFARMAAVSIGVNATFTAGGSVSLEAYLLDFDGDLYDKDLRLEFATRLRDEMRFASAEALVSEIRNDVARTRQVLA
jgi:riboflavin kinase/FMN adenylyltransferase